jgi:hypothetical protein
MNSPPPKESVITLCGDEIAAIDDRLRDIPCGTEDRETMGPVAAFNKFLCQSLTTPLAANIHLRRPLSEESPGIPIYLDDDPDHVYVLVKGSFPTYTIGGWIFGRDAMKPRHRV